MEEKLQLFCTTGKLATTEAEPEAERRLCHSGESEHPVITEQLLIMLTCRMTQGLGKRWSIQGIFKTQLIICFNAKQHSGLQFSPGFTKQRTSGQSVTTGDTVTRIGAARNEPSLCPGSALARNMTFPSMKYQVMIACTNAISNSYSLYCAGLP